MRAIDLMHLGHEHVICCWEADGLLIDPGPQSCEETLLAAIDGQQPKALLLTHIHFDHAGAAGALVRRWPDLPVYVHERGAKHLVDPARLVASAARLYGGDFLADEPYAEWAIAERDRLRAVAANGLRALAELRLARDDVDGAVIDLERLAELEPYDVDVHRRLIGLALRRGRRTEAVRRYNALRRRMLTTFGEELEFSLSDVAA